ncbi:MAG: NPCBM/NEW2 domain-containing protein [Spirochaetota bacterium]
MANYPNHQRITRAAISVQPVWIRSLLGTQAKRLGDHYCLYGDLVVSGKPSERKVMERFMTMPDGKRAVMGPASLDERENCRVWNKEFSFWYAAISAAIRRKRMADAAQYLGVIAHALGDTTALAHPLSHSEGLRMELIKRLFPTNKKYRYMSLHNLLENLPTSFSIRGHRPVLLGASAEEAAFFTAQEMVRLTTRTLAKLPNAIKKLYADDIPAVQRIAGDAYADSARIYADIMYTAFSMACGKAGRGSLPKTVCLDPLVPSSMSGWSPHPYFFKPLYDAPCNFDRRMEPFPLMLQAGARKKEYAHGFGMGVTSYIEYSLPAGVFRRFSCIIGLNAGLAERTAVSVAVTDGKRSLFKKTFRSVRDIEVLDIDLAGVRSLRFETTGAGKYEKFGTVDGHVVVADPVLMR